MVIMSLYSMRSGVCVSHFQCWPVKNKGTCGGKYIDTVQFLSFVVDLVQPALNAKIRTLKCGLRAPPGAQD